MQIKVLATGVLLLNLSLITKSDHISRDEESDHRICSCATEQLQIVSKENKTEVREEVNLDGNPLLPKDCGKDLSFRIKGGKIAELNEFPWMALLEYDTPEGKTRQCGGSLINNRYVLTAAHCIWNGTQPVNVILGEHRISTNPDCELETPTTKVCTLDTQVLNVEQWIVNDNKKDVALLRLSHDVNFTSNVQPICLPRNDSHGRFFHMAGWGADEQRTFSDVKLKVRLPFVDLEECGKAYRIYLDNTTICAGGEGKKDSCGGDSGGPLMSVEVTENGDARWSAFGVLSGGSTDCGTKGKPSFNTRVTSIVPWILKNIRP